MVSQGLLDELKVIFAEEFGVTLSAKTVSEIGNDLVSYFSLLAQAEEDNENKNENNRNSNN